jgi:predicted DNA-binding transcriptional regulator AlpA
MISRSGDGPTAPVSGPDERYVNSKQLREIIPASVMTLWRWQRDPEVAFPAPVKLGADGRNYWWLPGVHTWMRDREKRRAPLRYEKRSKPGQKANTKGKARINP